MRKETMLLKKALQFEYPDSKISVRFVQCTNYAYSSDRLVVSVSNVSFADIRTTLLHITRGMCIYRSGQRGSLKNDIYDPLILDVELNEFVSADCCEFIEVNG